MLHFFKLRQDLFNPQPAREVYVKPRAGQGWPEHCPPIRAANAFGFDILANFDLTFIQTRGQWSLKNDIVIASDFDYQPPAGGQAAPLQQQYAWFWQKGQKIPHVISDHVWKELRNQVKVSSFLFLATDPNELLMMSDVPNQPKPWRALSAVIDTDWYPASYPWHCVLELDNRQKRIVIKKGEPIARLIPVRRDTYFAQQMPQEAFDRFFTRSQKWLATHGRSEHEGIVDITKTYSKSQVRSRFIVKE